MTFGFTWGYSIHSGATITWSKAWGNAADFRIEGCRIFSKLGYRGTPKNHLCNRIFHCKPSSYWRSPWLWKPPILYIVLNTLKGCCPCAWLVVPLYPAISAYETRCINKQNVLEDGACIACGMGCNKKNFHSLLSIFLNAELFNCQVTRENAPNNTGRSRILLCTPQKRWW